jgi:hypothetical protein
VIPFLIAATVLGISRLTRPRQVLGATVVLVGSIVMTLWIGPLPGALAPADIWYQEPVPPQHVAALREGIALVPDDVPVSATNKAGSHLSARRYIYSVPVVGRAEWMLLDSRDPWLIADPGQLAPRDRPDVLRAFVQRIERDPAWEPIFSKDGVLVFRRVGS